MTQRVVACVIQRNGCLLVCQRPPDKRHGGLWEFPGGKVESNETDDEAAARELLEADRHPLGEPVVTNGLGLCKIHHSAYDAHIIGIDPEFRVHVRDDILREKDGPMLKHGLQEAAGSRLILPRKEELRPNVDYLAERFDRFQAA